MNAQSATPSAFGIVTRRLWIPLLVVALAAAGCAGASPTPASSSTPAAGNGGPGIGTQTDVRTEQGTTPVVPAAGNATTMTGASGAAGMSYPYPGYGTAAVAPEKTIVAVGVGKADMKVDGSDRAAAQEKAITAAIADARAQAGIVAASMHVTLAGTYSVAVSLGEQQMYAEGTGCAVPPTEPNAGSSATPARAPTPQPCKPATPQATSAQVFASVTVAFSFTA